MSMKRKLYILGICGGLVALAIRVYDLAFVKFTVKDTAFALVWIVVLCSVFVSLRRDALAKNVTRKNDNAA